MKNVHILKTDKPSILSDCENYKHLYITSDEEIKEGDYVIHNNGIYKVKENKGTYLSVFELNSIVVRIDLCKKIILTTDPDLVDDNVQAIDDEFLEWFVKNPSCEEVDVNRNYLGSKCLKCGFIENHDEVDTKDCSKCYNTTYEHLYNNKIIIPQEESQQEKLEESDKWSLEKAQEFALARFKSNHKKGTITVDLILEILKVGVLTGHTFGAKWQSERMYSEEDMEKAYSQGWMTRERFNDLSPEIVYPDGLDYEEKQDYAFNLWFEQHKKK